MCVPIFFDNGFEKNGENPPPDGGSKGSGGEISITSLVGVGGLKGAAKGPAAQGKDRETVCFHVFSAYFKVSLYTRHLSPKDFVNQSG